ncbi:hypothetical protein Gorai_023125 [Gossypium raimondii]|uniref:Uncharacterized protein n=1 Tax=Gossypium raimondii TaxID=29730 RepID=A0A7J8NVB2_GOSRA|nr:hypothetical protein [Gossypium raimondii]
MNHRWLKKVNLSSTQQIKSGIMCPCHISATTYLLNS